METAKEVGEILRFLSARSKHVGISLGADVSGKGIPAAMFMMTAKNAGSRAWSKAEWESVRLFYAGEQQAL